MALLINAQDLSKTYGSIPLFRSISLSVFDGERLGLIGPNGSGKSTLLEILTGKREPDSGEVAIRKNVRLSYVAQEAQFEPEDTVLSVLRKALREANILESDWTKREGETLGRTGFTEFETNTSALSGGWRKRLAIATALVQNPDILLLDEPTNHLDIAGIEWLEKLLVNASFACVVISHDRYFLENVATGVAELNRIYPGGLYRVKGNYSEFLEAKDDFLAAQAKHQEALQNRVRTEIEWLRRGPKARATKAKARIDNAHALIAELVDLKSRSRSSTAGIDFSESGRKTKRLIELEQVTYGYGGRTLFRNFDFTVKAGTRIGLVGPNGSGKTTMLRLMMGEMQPESGTVRRADDLRMVYFDQTRQLDPNLTLRRALAADGDSVLYRDRVIHVATWAQRFLFSTEQLNQPVSRLSGGERARVLIAKLMLEPADVLLLDEPTNDLDIPTLEILEESLLEFNGALLLVTHDRFMLDRVSTVVLGLDGEGGAGTFADYSQWDAWLSERERAKSKTGVPAVTQRDAPVKRKLSYLDQRDYQSIEERISEAEQQLKAKQAELEDIAVVSDPRRLQQINAEIDTAQRTVDDLYARWAELEAKMA
ncbi:MAG: ABC-F family ATP-binding cassette domain-containing protein [Bryobacteraceae bacterium]